MSSTVEYWKPSVTADVVIVNSHLAEHRVDGGFINLILVKRDPNSSAFPSSWALPGGFITKGESLEDCAVREVKEETGIDAKMLAYIGTFSSPDRDPRGQVISTAYMTMVMSTNQSPLELKAGDDAVDIGRFRLKGEFREEDGALEVSLSNPKTNQTIEFVARFTRDMRGIINTQIEYTSNIKLAFDHAEIIARTILRVPDLVLPTKPRKAEDVLKQHLAESEEK